MVSVLAGWAQVVQLTHIADAFRWPPWQGGSEPAAPSSRILSRPPQMSGRSLLSSVEKDPPSADHLGGTCSLSSWFQLFLMAPS